MCSLQPRVLLGALLLLVIQKSRRPINDSCIIEIGIATSHLVWLLRTRGVRKRAREAGKSFDEFDGGIQWQAKGPDICKTLSCVFKRQRMFEESIGYDA
jgi:hypothetical protein